MALDKSMLVKRLDNFELAWRELVKLWLDEDDQVSETLNTDYPFDSCFNELYVDVYQWVDNAKQRLRTFVMDGTDGEEISLARLIWINKDCPFTEEELEQIKHLKVDEHITLGGGASAERVLFRNS